MIFYVVGWTFFGTVIIITLLGYAYGIETFQIQLSNFNSEFVSIVGLIVAITTGLIITYFNYERIKRYLKNLADIAKRIKVDSFEFEFMGLRLQLEAKNPTEELILLRTELEVKLRKLSYLSGVYSNKAKRPTMFVRLVYELLNQNIIKSELAESLRFVYSNLSKAVHGETFSKEETKLFLEIGMKTLLSLEDVIKEYELPE